MVTKNSVSVQQIEREVMKILYEQWKHNQGKVLNTAVRTLRQTIQATLQGHLFDHDLEGALQNLVRRRWVEATGRLIDGSPKIHITPLGIQQAMRLFDNYATPSPPPPPPSVLERRKFLVQIGSVVIAALALFFAVYQFVTSSHLPPITPTPTAVPTRAVLTNAPSGCSVDNTVYADRNLAMGVTVHVETGRGVSVREGPGADLYTEKFVWTNLVDPVYPPGSPVVIKRYQTAQIIDGPRCIPSQRLGETIITWWHLQFPDGERGWTAGNDRDGPILRADNP